MAWFDRFFVILNMKEHGGGSELIKPISFLADLNHFLANFTPKVCNLGGEKSPRGS